MPPWVIDVDWWMQMYPGLTPDDILHMDITCYDHLPTVRGAWARAEQMRARAGDGAARFGRRQ